MSVATSSGRLLFFVISILLDFILINAAGLHLKNSKMARDGISSVTEKECSINLYNANGTCTKCPKGTQGKSCSEKCQANMYGELCLEKCDCQPHHECNNIHGCIDTWGICSNKESRDVICCDNFMLSNGYCKACPSGTFWTNCSLVCPDGYYGMFPKKRVTAKCQNVIKLLDVLKTVTLILTIIVF
ncbi:cell death abnormality protein 1-like [Magallana gigas]|uniref:cell death abnormality protein 1-like n=1 Tax=Magallana gigas TaxID=29159 RepID=UPI00333FC677